MSAVHEAAVRLLVIYKHPELLRLPSAERGPRNLLVEQVSSIEAALLRLRAERQFAVVLFDASSSDLAAGFHHPREIALDVDRLRRASPGTQFIACVERHSDAHLLRTLIEHGVIGILEYTEAGIDPVQFEQRLQDATQAYRQVRTAADRLHEHPIFEQTGFVGRSSIMAELLQSAVRAAEISDVPVLIYGETGTGKQLLAETIHRLDSKRRGKRFQTVNCAAIAGPLAESALFGHIKGAFTGATENRQGYFRAADGGTILLDEIGETELRLQAKLLRVLQEGLVLPVGSDDEYPVDVRVIAATNRRLDELVERRKFRLDLYNRLNVICIEIPPLRERPEDVPPLIDHLLEKYRRYARRPVREVDPGVYDVLQNAALQGNVRELENIIRQTLAFKTGGDRVDVSDLPRSAWLKCRTTANARGTLPTEVVRGLCDSIRKGTTTLPEFLSECERVFLSTALDESVENTRLDLAKQLGLSRRTLYNKRRRYGL